MCSCETTRLDGDPIPIVEPKGGTTEQELRDVCRRYLAARNIGESDNEWHYKATVPRVMFERLLSDARGQSPVDYKFYVFGGRVEYVHLDFDRFTEHRRTFFDRNWRKMDFGVEYPLGPDTVPPNGLDEMIALAERLANGFDFVRVDLYHLDDGEIVFGELTFTPDRDGNPSFPIGSTTIGSASSGPRPTPGATATRFLRQRIIRHSSKDASAGGRLALTANCDNLSVVVDEPSTHAPRLARFNPLAAAHTGMRDRLSFFA